MRSMWLVAACCLAVVLAGHSADAMTEGIADGQVVSLQENDGDEENTAAKLRALGDLVKRTPTPQVQTALQRGFTPNLWRSWEREALAQKLDVAGSVAVLNSYLCANVDNGNKVMHVMSWVKRTMHSRRNGGDAKHAKLMKRVSDLQQRVQDTSMLAKATKSRAAAKLAHQTQLAFDEAHDELVQYDELGQSPGPQNIAAKQVTKDGVEELNAAQKQDKKAQEQDRSRIRKGEYREKSLKAKAKELQNKATAVTFEMNSAASHATLANMQEVGVEETRADAARAEALKETVSNLKKEAAAAAEAADAADQANNLFKKNGSKNVPIVSSKAARMKNEVLLNNLKKVLEDAQSKQTLLIREKVETSEKLRLAESTLRHAKSTKDESLITKSETLVAAARTQSDAVVRDIATSRESMEQAATKLQKVVKKQEKTISKDFKRRIHNAVDETRALRKKSMAIIAVHQKEAYVAKKVGHAASKRVSAAQGAADKAKQKSDMDESKAKALQDKANKINQVAEPLELQQHVAKLEMQSAEEDMELAKESGEVSAMHIANMKLGSAKKHVASVKTKLTALGSTPTQLRAHAEQFEDLAVHEANIEHKAQKTAEEELATQKEAMASFDKAQKVVDNQKQVILPTLLRNVHTRVAFIEHALQQELHSLKRLGGMQLTPKYNAEHMEAQLMAQRAAQGVKIGELKKLRMKVNALRKTADVALAHAKKLQESTEEADKKIEALKQQACSETKQLEAQRAKSKSKNPGLEAEVSRARAACQKASNTLASARLELQKRAQDVAAASEKARIMEEKYTADDENLAAKEADVATEDSITEKETSEEDNSKLFAIEAMIKQGEARKAQAQLMKRAALATNDSVQKETADAAIAAAQHHLDKLKKHKAQILQKTEDDKKELGELHHSLQSDITKIKDDESHDTTFEMQLGDEQNSALREAATAKVQQTVNHLTMQLAKETKTREEEAVARTEQAVDVRAQMAKMRAKLGSINQAAVSVLDDLDEAINEGNEHFVQKAKKDIKISESKLSKLNALNTTAQETVKSAEAELTKAQQSDDNTAKAAGIKKLEQARQDLTSVQNAAKKVQEKREADIKEVSGSSNKVAQKAIGSFAKKLKEKFEKLQESAMHESKHDITLEQASWEQQGATNVNATRALEGRITSLEDAVASLGGNVKQIEATSVEGSGNNRTRWTEKRAKVEARIRELDDVIAAAKAGNDTDAEITAGTEQKDLEHEVENIQAALGMNQQVNPSDGVDVAALSGTSPLSNVTVKEVKDLTEEQDKLYSAIQQVKAASHKRVDEVKKEKIVGKELKQAVEEESLKILDAKKAKESLSQKMTVLSEQEVAERVVVQAAKKKLTKQVSDLKQAEVTAKQKQQEIKVNLATANKIISETKLPCNETDQTAM